MFGEKEKILSIYSIALNESTNLVGVFRHESWTLPIDPAKNTSNRTPITSGAPVWCRPKTCKNKYPYLNKTENTCEQCVFVIISSSPFT